MTCKEPFKRRTLHLFQRLLYFSGLTQLYNFIHPPSGALILMYHSVVDEVIDPYIHDSYSITVADFEKQMQYLKRNFKLISLETLTNHIGTAQKIPEKAVVITFDDGYLNNLELAAPILSKYQFPATVFLSTDYTNQVEPQWVDKLHSILEFRTINSIHYQDTDYNLDHNNDYCRFFSVLSNQLKTAADIYARQKLLEKIETSLQPKMQLPKLTMSWDDVRRFINDFPLITMELHGHSHANMPALDSNNMAQEILKGLQTFQRELGYTPKHFAYPYGLFSQPVIEQLKNQDFNSAVITSPACLVNSNHNRYRLPRYGVNRSMLDFKMWLHGGPRLAKLLVNRVYP